jgi:DNA polymerase-4
LKVTTVGELATFLEKDLIRHFGRHGASLARRARGIDRRSVVTAHEAKSVSHERTFSRDLNDPEALERELEGLSKSVAKRLSASELVAGTVAIKLRYADFTTISRQTSLSVPTNEEEVIIRFAQTLLRRAWQRGRPVRLLGVAARRLSPPIQPRLL